MHENDGYELPDIFSDAGRKYAGIGTAREEIVCAVNSFWIDCGRPACRLLAQISETVCQEIALPEEAGFKLARRPRPFTLHTSRQLMRLIGHRDERWRKYLFY